MYVSHIAISWLWNIIICTPVKDVTLYSSKDKDTPAGHKTVYAYVFKLCETLS